MHHSDSQMRNGSYSHLRYVNSRGLMELCDCYPESSRRDIFKSDTHGALDFTRCRSVPNGSLIYVVTSELCWFEEQAFTDPLRFNSKFILVTGGSVQGPREAMRNSSRLLNMLKSTAIIRWYSQNVDFYHKKLHSMPLGIDYHSAYDQQNIHPEMQERMLLNIRRLLPPLQARPNKFLSDIHHKRYGRQDALVRIGKASSGGRETCLNGVEKAAVEWLPRMSRASLWRAHSKGRFMLSPTGVGQDCHRTYEALALGTIPIVSQTILTETSLFNGLCLKVVGSWSNVTINAMNDIVSSYRHGECTFGRQNLMEYWREEFQMARLLR